MTLTPDELAQVADNVIASRCDNPKSVMKKITWQLAIKTVSEANCSEHWAKKNARHKQQHFFVHLLFKSLKKPIPLPCSVTLTRQAPRMMDAHENLGMSLKYIADQIAEELTGVGGFYITKKGQVRTKKGHADSDQRITWHYKQEKSTCMGVLIEIEYADPEQLPDTPPPSA